MRRGAGGLPWASSLQPFGVVESHEMRLTAINEGTVERFNRTSVRYRAEGGGVSIPTLENLVSNLLELLLLDVDGLGNYSVLLLDDTEQRAATITDGRALLANLACVRKVSVSFSVEPNGDGSTGLHIDQVQNLSTRPDDAQWIATARRMENCSTCSEPPDDRPNPMWMEAAVAPAYSNDRDAFSGEYASRP